jgi:hypothetical protein
VLLFAALIMNGDRHAHNMSHNTHTNELTIFDHSHAFMRPSGDVDALLNANRGQLAIGGHCLAAQLNSWNGFAAWAAKVKSIPDYYLEGAVDEACRVGIPQGRQAAIYDFMRQRRDTIDSIVINHKAVFPKLPPAGQ